MGRVVIRTEKGPYRLKEGDKKNICMCGLSGNQPFCDGSHAKVMGEKEGKLYQYDGMQKKEVKIEEEE